jgi:hypothetical protein
MPSKDEQPRLLTMSDPLTANLQSRKPRPRKGRNPTIAAKAVKVVGGISERNFYYGKRIKREVSPEAFEYFRAHGTPIHRIIKLLDRYQGRTKPTETRLEKAWRLSSEDERAMFLAQLDDCIVSELAHE